MTETDIDRLEEGDEIDFAEVADDIEYWGGEDKPLVISTGEREVYLNYSKLEVTDVNELEGDQ